MSNEPTIAYTKGEWYLQKYTDAYTNIIRCNNGKHQEVATYRSIEQTQG